MTTALLSALSDSELRKYLDVLRTRLDENTLAHCISATEFLLREPALARRVVPRNACQAGLLHDLCKPYSNRKLLARAKQFGLEINSAQRRNPKLLHGPVSAEECRRDFGVDNEEVLEAVRWHTTGRPGLGTLGLCLYFADFAEPRRQREAAMKGREVLRAEGFGPALRYVVDSKLEHILKKRTVDPVTLAFTDWVRQSLG